MALRGRPELSDRQHRLARKLLGLRRRVALPFSLQDDDIQKRRVTMGGTTVTRVTGSAREKRKGVMGKDRAEVIVLDAPAGVIPPT
jgi:hypothetical protein